MQIRKLLTALIIACALSIASLAQAVAATKAAMVVGNGAYAHAPALSAPARDAASVAGALRAAGFDVTEHLDLTQRHLEDAMQAFAEQASQADIALIYYTGHGLQVGAINHIVPTDVALDSARDMRRLTPLDYLLQDAARARQLGIVIIDASRDNPFVRRLAESHEQNSDSGVGRGLAPITDLPDGTFVAYATQAGNIAVEGNGASMSPYAAALTHHLGTENADIRLVFGAIRDDVVAATGRRQEPFSFGNLGTASILLNETDAGSGSAGGGGGFISALPAVELESTSSVAADYAAWSSAVTRGSWEKLTQISRQHTDSVFSHLAARLIQYGAASSKLTVTQALAVLRALPFHYSETERSFIIVVQSLLSDLNYYAGPIDGHFNTQTVEALTAYVTDSGGGPLNFGIIVDLATQAATRQTASVLTGRWRGRYHYPVAQNGITSVDFEMDLTFSQGRISGFVIEPNTFGDNTSANLYANFDGQVAGNLVEWQKTYDGTAGVSHSVWYTGTIERGRRTITGRWIISDDWSGDFEITLE